MNVPKRVRPEDIDMKEYLNDLCERTNLSLFELARILGVSHVTVYYWRDGKVKPSPLAWEKLRKLKRKLDRKEKKEGVGDS